MEGDSNLTQEIRQNACDLLRAHPFPALTDSSIRSLRLLAPLASVSPASTYAQSPAHDLNFVGDREADVADLPNDLLDTLAQAESIPLVHPAVADTSAPLAATGPLDPQPQATTSSSSPFDPDAFFQSFLRDTLRPAMDVDESEPSDSDIDMLSPSRPAFQLKSKATSSSSTSRYRDSASSKRQGRTSSAASAAQVVALARELLRAQVHHQGRRTHEAAPHPPLDAQGCVLLSDCKQLSRLLGDLAKERAGRQIWTTAAEDHDEDDDNEAEEREEQGDRLTVHQITQLLKLLMRSVDRAAGLQVLPPEKLKAGKAAPPPPTPASKKSKASASAAAARKRKTSSAGQRSGSVKAKRGRSARSSSRSAGSTSPSSDSDPLSADTGPEAGTSPPSSKRDPLTWTQAEAEKLGEGLHIVSNASAAIEAILSLLVVDKLPKQVYAEEIIESCFAFVKTQLSGLIYPLAEWSSAASENRASLLDRVFELASPEAADVADALLTLFPGLVSRMAMLLKTEDMPEHILITAIYAAIGPFFVDLGGSVPSSTRSRSTAANKISSSSSSSHQSQGKAKDMVSAGSLTLKTLRLSALSVVRAVYAKHAAQRKWIIEEILTSLTQVPDIKKKTFVMRNGKAIHTVSALLLHLVQSAAHHLVQRVQHKLGRLESDGAFEDEGVSVEQAQRAVCQSETSDAVDAANAAAGLIVGFLLKKTRSASKNTAEVDYKFVLENIVTDALALFDLEEWPGAQFFTSICLTRMLNVAAATETSADGNALKSTCLDHISTVASRLYSRKKVVERELPLKSLPQLLTDRADFHASFERTAAAHRDLIGHLSITQDEDAASETATAFASAFWASDLLKALERLDGLHEEGIVPPSEVRLLQGPIFQELSSLWSLQKQFESRKMASQLKIDPEHSVLVGQAVAWTSGQSELTEVLLRRILKVLEESNTAAHRTKALKCLEAIVAEDAEVFALSEVREAIEERFKDAQASVRDAAFDLLGKHIILRPDLALDYLPHILERINDKGVNVRKRATKLLNRLYKIIPEMSSRVRVASKLLWRVRDDDASIKELAVAAISDLILEPTTKAFDPVKEIAFILMQVASGNERMPPLDDALIQMTDKRVSDKDATETLLLRLQAIGSVLVEFMVESDNAEDIDKSGCAKVLEVLSRVHRKLISPRQVRSLLPLLTPSADPQERALRDNLLRALQVVIVHLPASSLATCRALQATLIKLLTSTPVFSFLQTVVGCLCAVVLRQTKDYGQLSKIFVAMHRKLDLILLAVQNDPADSSLPRTHYVTLSTLIWGVSLLCEHADFDLLRETDPDAQLAMDSMCEGDDSDVTADTFVKLVNIYASPVLSFVKHNALLGMGCIFRAHPTFMVDTEATIIMDEIFAAGEEQQDARVRLLHVFQDFLSRQASLAEQDLKESSRPQTVAAVSATTDSLDLEELIGNTDSFADSGVSSAVAQRHLRSILAAARSTCAPARNAAFEIIGFIVRQGLAHPLTTLPTIVAIECHPEPAIAKRAFALHSILDQKHAALIHTQFLECAREAFHHQKQLSGSNVPPRGYVDQEGKPVALFTLWHSLVKEKRPRRRDFFKALLKGLSVDPALLCTKDDVDLARFLCDNLALLDYKVQEDIFVVIRSCDRILAEGAMQTLELLQEAYCKMEEDEEGLSDSTALEAVSTEGPTLPSLINTSLCLTLVALLRRHLKLLYSLTDSKCAKFIEGKKTSMGDKAPMQNPNVSPSLDLSQHPHLLPSVNTLSPEHYREQTDRFSELMSSNLSAEREADDSEDNKSDDPDFVAP